MNCRRLIIALLAFAPAFARADSPNGSTPPAPLTKEQSDFFETKIRPIFATNCYKCHSTEQRKSKGGLVLDSREGWSKGGEHGPAIVPGDPAASLLLKAVRFEDADLQMPPNGDKLSDAEIAALEQWVKMGAPDPRVADAAAVAGKLTGLTDAARSHWAFQPVKPVDVPPVKDAAWVKTPVDAFVLARLEANGMAPSAPAPREALIRRATYDLIGLPPTPEEVRDFVSDSSPDAFEKVVERLLASPHYGERWGRHWLDTARYADTTGGEDKKIDYRYPFAWAYRDYVIQSFNADKPYDLFLKEQIAADLLPESKGDPARLAALGFLTVGKRFQNPNDTIDERIDAVSKGTLALTVSCARCHDHKFDPIPTADYYSLHGIFASTIEPADKPLIGDAPAGADYEEFKARLAELEEANRKIYFNLVAAKSAEFRKNAGAYLLAANLGRRNQPSAERLKLRTQLIRELNLDRDIYQNGLRSVVRREDPVFGAWTRFAEIPETDFAKQAPDVLAAVLRGGDRRRPINSLVVGAFQGVRADSLHSLRDVADVYSKLFAGIDERARAYLEACRTATASAVTADAGPGGESGLAGGAAAGFEPALIQLFKVPAEVVPAYALTTDKLRQIAPRLPVVNGNAYGRFRLAEINELQLTHPGSPARAMAVADSPRPRNSQILIRGEQQNPGPVVMRQFLEILAGPNRKPFTAGSGRLELANAIAAKDNSLTARVMVNRIWMHHFGAGLVRTPDDLGVQSEAPSHPDLLDYLAGRFVEGGPVLSEHSESKGWSVKQMHRLVMLSSTYQQRSDTNDAFAQKDPENRLLWRANLRRLDFEAVRDSMLVFTGTLDPSLGGKPVNLSDEPYSNRRSVYGYIDRGDLPELLDQFDFADPDMANTKRVATIVPQQALFFMNSPMAVDVARKVTGRAEFVAATDDTARVAALYEVLFQRTPREDEVALALDFIRGAEKPAGESVVHAIAAPGGPAENVPSSTVADSDSDSDGEMTMTPRDRRAQRQARRQAMDKASREQTRQQMMKERRKAMQAEQAKNRRASGRASIRNEGERVARRPLTAWEEYAQALLFANEMVYVN